MTVRRILPMAAILSLLLLPLSGAAGAPLLNGPSDDEVRAAIGDATAWLIAQQDGDGGWGYYDRCAYTALVVKKFEHHAVDPKWGFGLDSPFSDEYPYKENLERGWDFLFGRCVQSTGISTQTHGDPDSDGDGLGVLFREPSSIWHSSYASGIGLMSLCEVVEFDRVVDVGPLSGWTYGDVARDVMDYLAYGQNDGGPQRGSWGYYHNYGWGDNSNSGWVTLGLGFAEASPPAGCGFAVPQFVKDELNIWIDYIQNDSIGGSGYDHPNSWVNVLKTGNLLQQMAFVGDTPSTGRVQDALDYLELYWNHPSQDPGWSGGGGTASYQATFTVMKGLSSLGINEFGDPPIDWQTDFETELLSEQYPDGAWRNCRWGNDILCTTWGLLTLQRVAPPKTVPVDFKPGSCPNPLNVKDKGVVPIAIVGTEGFDVTEIDPASVTLEGVSPLRWSWEDVATPYEPYVGKEGAYDCHELGADSYMDLTLKFNAQEVIAAIGDVEDGDVLALHLAGNLKDEFGGLAFNGEDVVKILKKGK